MLTRERIVAFISETFDVDPAELEDESLLFTSGLLDSFSMIELVAFIEGEVGFKLGAADFALENLDSVGRILQFLESRAGVAER